MRRLCNSIFTTTSNLSAIACALMMLFTSISLSSCTEDDGFSFYASVSGTVVDVNTGMPISGVNITVTPSNTSVLTKEDGTFEFNNLYSQQYTFLFQKAGYQPNRKNLTLEAGKEAQIVVTLAPIP